jgi:hypothetical protein
MSSGVGLMLGTLAKSCAIQVWRFQWLEVKGKSDPLVERVRPIPPYPLVNQKSKRTESQNR